MASETRESLPSSLAVTSASLLFVLAMRKRRKIALNRISETRNGRRDDMKDIVWIFRSFGFRAGITFVWDSLVRKLRRKSSAPIFEELNDEEARQVAWAFGIFRWQDREDLNDQWNAFDKHTLH
jgi:hypothetical protein